MEQAWFEFVDIKTKPRCAGVWVPIRASLNISGSLGNAEFGSFGDFLGVHSLAFHPRHQERVLNLDWNAISPSSSGPVIDGTRYTPTGIRRPFSIGAPGIELVLEQDIPGERFNLWSLHQDLVFALGLLKEGDKWVRPSEDYREAVRFKRDPQGRPELIEIRQDMLRDYLCARNLGLCVWSFQERYEIKATLDEIAWPNGRLEENLQHGRWSGFTAPVDEQGMIVGDWSVTQISRPYADPTEDDPTVCHRDQFETKQQTFRRAASAYRVDGRLWKTEWLPPGNTSTRVRGDKELPVHFILGTAGDQTSSSALQDGGKWIWFRPEVIPALAKRRGGSLSWNSRETGNVACSPGNEVVFGLNRVGLITVYAKDIAYLPNWQQRIWSAYNVSPEGGLSKEMHQTQVVGEFVHTRAPEVLLEEALEGTNQVFADRTGKSLFIKHHLAVELTSKLCRFNGLEWAGLLSLAKDIARLTADRIDTKALRTLIPDSGELGSLKLLEKYLSTLIGEEEAKSLMGPLFCIYDLRLGDAHLPKQGLEQRLLDMGVDPDQPLVWQSAHMMFLVARSLAFISKAIAA